ncbi:MAG: hypothetical protein GOP50_06535 [Candidatus Heimdallarchaeota archaeon]|nr:hypothetical protein [Candidatus Heimdallarchaeota archaeon]
MSSSNEKQPPEWQEVQLKMATILENNSFEIWKERSIANRRVDILAKRAYKNKTYYIIFEFKHYENVTGGVEDKFLEQLRDYLKLFIERELRRKGFDHVSKNYVFIGYLVLSKDYGIYKNRRKNWRKNKLFPEDKDLESIWKRNLYLFSSTEKYIRPNLESIGLTFYSQSTIEDFTTKEI